MEKAFLITAVTKYLTWVLRYANHNLDQQFLLMNASAGEAATGVNGITLHTAFHLPFKSGLKSCKYKKPNDETLHMLRSKYWYLKVFIIDKISMTEREIFGHLDLASKAIMQNSSRFGGVFFLSCRRILTNSTG